MMAIDLSIREPPLENPDGGSGLTYSARLAKAGPGEDFLRELTGRERLAFRVGSGPVLPSRRVKWPVSRDFTVSSRREMFTYLVT